MAIKMIALTSFMGVEGLIKNGQSFQVRDQARADYLERVHYAARNDEAKAAYSTQSLAPTVTQTAAPTQTSIRGPENTQEIEPENTKAEISQISPQEQPEAEPLASISETDLNDASYADLKAVAKGLEIKGYSSMKKDKLIETIQKRQSGGKNNDN